MADITIEVDTHPEEVIDLPFNLSILINSLGRGYQGYRRGGGGGRGGYYQDRNEGGRGYYQDYNDGGQSYEKKEERKQQPNKQNISPINDSDFVPLERAYESKSTCHSVFLSQTVFL